MKTTRPSLRAFIQANRGELEAAIQRVVVLERKLTVKDIELWVLNDEWLHRWARREGVRI